jgi:high-affinity iron transporter
LVLLGFAPIVALLIWQGVTSHGSPDPTVANTGRWSAVLDISVLVFREGLETILVLAAITAGLARKGENRGHTIPIFTGAALGLLATLVTWFVVRGIVSDLRIGVAGRDRPNRGDRSPHRDELVFPQGLLGRLDHPA